MSKTYKPVARISGEDAAARVLEVFTRNPDKVISLDTLMKWTNLRHSQVTNGERYLKSYLAEHPEVFGEWTLYIALGPDSMHGLIQDGEASKADAIGRIAYMMNRAETELAYREQQIARIADPKVKRQLNAGMTFFRAAKEAFAEAYDRIS
jgi:hypothetical protein